MKLADMTEFEKRTLATLVRVMVGVDGKYTDAETTRLEQAANELGADEFWREVEAAGHEPHTEESIRDRARAIERKAVQTTIYKTLFGIAAAGAIVGPEGDLLDWLAATWGLKTPEPLPPGSTPGGAGR